MLFFVFELPTLKMFLICSYFYQFQPPCSYKVCTVAVKAVHSFYIGNSNSRVEAPERPKIKQLLSTAEAEHGIIILNRSKNSVFLCLKICWNRQVFGLIRVSGIWMKTETLRHQASFSKFQIQYLNVLIWI